MTDRPDAPNERKRRASGPTIPEDRRAAKQCLLRLRPETIADLDALTSRLGPYEERDGRAPRGENLKGLTTMPGNPKDSEWYSTPKEKRKRKGIEITISDEARQRLDDLAEARGVSRSVVVETLIMGASAGGARKKSSGKG